MSDYIYKEGEKIPYPSETRWQLDYVADGEPTVWVSQGSYGVLQEDGSMRYLSRFELPEGEPHPLVKEVREQYRKAYEAIMGGTMMY